MLIEIHLFNLLVSLTAKIVRLLEHISRLPNGRRNQTVGPRSDTMYVSPLAGTTPVLAQPTIKKALAIANIRMRRRKRSPIMEL